MKFYYFKSERLGFRAWMQSDLIPFVKMNQDKDVMKYFPSLLTKEESISTIERFMQHFNKYEYGFYAVDLLETGEFIGFIGFSHPRFESHFTPCVEIGWRLATKYWQKGLATEGALACLSYGKSDLGINEVYSFTTISNIASYRVMEKIGMSCQGTFKHPLINPGHELEEHVLYHVQI